MMGSLCGLNREDGFLHGGRGKKRKYVLGNQLLELLVQLAVVGFRKGQFVTQPITVSDFVKWLRDPQKVQPGTKMPSFYPGGPDDVLGGKEDLQIEALRDYIMTLGRGAGTVSAPTPAPATKTKVAKR